MAGVSALGISGTNAHVVLEGYPEPDGKRKQEKGSVVRKTRLLPLSAKSDAALRELACSYLSWLSEHTDDELANMAWTASMGRSHFTHRAGVVFDNAASLREGLQKIAEAGGSPTSPRTQHSGKTMFGPRPEPTRGGGHRF